MSSGAALFAEASVLVCRAERVNSYWIYPESKRLVVCSKSVVEWQTLVSYPDQTSLNCVFTHFILSIQGPVVQSVVSLTSLLRVISLTVLADSVYNILIFFAEKM